VSSPWPDREERFRDLYRAHFDAVLGYARRRTDQPSDAADVVAETFLISWRRLDQMPGGAEDRLWLFGVARRVLANQHRSDRRREHLGQRLREQLAEPLSADPAGPVTDRVLVLAALRRLGDLDREVLTLSVWEALEPREIAVVLGVTPTVARARLSRARARLRDLLDETGDEEPAPGHVSSATRASLLPIIQES
jgi:RNA polymerase sigma-70 factor (ECF subfamily)